MLRNWKKYLACGMVAVLFFANVPVNVFALEDTNVEISEDTEAEGAEDTDVECGDYAVLGQCGDNLTWGIDGNTLIISGTGDMWDYFPEGYGETMPWGEYKETLTKLEIGTEVTSIGEFAFRGCSGFAGELTIPDGVTTIGGGAFEDCGGFTGALTIPNSVTYIGSYAFSDCSGFTGALTIPDGVTTINPGAFYACSGFDGALTIPDSVITIEEYAFRGCSGFTGELTIPDGVTTIQKYAFCECSGFDGGLTIPDGVTTIGERAFSECSGFDGRLTIPDGVTSIGYAAFSGCNGFTGELTIPDGVASIGGYAFCECSGFTGGLTIPDSVTTIGEHAFRGCSGFTEALTIPDNVTSIGNYAFWDCSGFTGALTIPDGVTTIENGAFAGCSGFTGELTIPDSVTTIGDYAFWDCSGLECLTFQDAPLADMSFLNSLPEGFVVYYPEAAGGWDVTAQEYPHIVWKVKDNIVTGQCGDNLTWTIEGSVLTISGTGDMWNYSYGNNGEERLVPPWIEDGYIDVLTELNLENGITSIGDLAFSAGFNFAGDLVIPDSVTQIGSYAFTDCDVDGELVLPDGLETISAGAFQNCSGLKGNLIIPDSVTSIGAKAFYGCKGFTGELIIPDGVTEIGGLAFMNCTGLENLVLSPDTTAIGFGAFMGGSGLQGTVEIPETVETIGARAFEGCTALTDIIFEGDAVADNTYLDTVPEGMNMHYYISRTGWEELVETYTQFNWIAISDEEILTGQCGDNLIWTIEGSTLTISGTGDMWDYEPVYVEDTGTYTSTAPWWEYNTTLTELKLEEGITYIGNYAFIYCSNLSGSLVIPDSVTTIGKNAFRSCSGFTGSLVLSDNLTTIGESAFAGWCGFTGTLSFPDSVTTIGNAAFSGCSGFTDIASWGGLTEIPNGAFSACGGLTSLKFSDKITKIGPAAFMNCSSLQGTVVIPETIETISARAFSGCTSLTDIIFKGDALVDNTYLDTVPEGMNMHYYTNRTGWAELVESYTQFNWIAEEPIPAPEIIGIKDNFVFYFKTTVAGRYEVNVLRDGEVIFSTSYGNQAADTEVMCSSSIRNINESGVYQYCVRYVDKTDAENPIEGDWVYSEEFTYTKPDKKMSPITVEWDADEPLWTRFEVLEACSGCTWELYKWNEETGTDEWFSGTSTFRTYAYESGSTAWNNWAILGYNKYLEEPGKYRARAKAYSGDLVNVAHGDWSEFTDYFVVEEGDVIAISLDKYKVELEADATVQLTATVRIATEGTSDTTTEQTVTWTSSDMTVATVNEAGLVTGIEAGTAIITAKAGAFTSSCKVTVTSDSIEDSTVEIEVEDTDVKVDISMSDEEQNTLLEDLATEEEWAALEAGLSAIIKLLISSAENILTDTQKQVLEEVVTEAQYEVGRYLDIAMTMQVGDNDARAVTETNVPVEIVIDVPEDLQQAEREFSVIRIHDGVATVLEDLDDNPATVTFQTDRFSSYTLVYQDAETRKAGDINNDGTINVLDKKLLYNHIAGIAELTGEDLTAADVNGDGTINVLDKKLLYNHIAGISLLW